MNNRQQFYVFVTLNGDTPVVAGYHEIDLNQNRGTFFYGRSYCENPNAYPLDPINLPLIYDKRFYFPITRFNASGIPGALLDCGPDEWGKRILNHFYDPKPVTEADYLVMGSGYGVGALMFADTTTIATHPTTKASHDLEQLYYTAMTFDNSDVTQVNLQPLLMPSSGIGGARPKAHVFHNGKAYIAKFNRRDDVFDNTLTEYCMMQLAKSAGIKTADVELIKTQYGNALLVERFDTGNTNPKMRRHLLSANALLNIQEVSQLNDVSYDRIAAIGKQISRSKTMAEDVFTRMLFNIAIGNTDDHTRNHAFLKHPTEGHYELSPAYDLVPLPQRLSSHAINIGPFGQRPTKDNIQSGGKLMGLSLSKQKACVERVFSALENLDEKLQAMGMSKTDVDYLQPCFQLLRAAPKLYPH